MSLFITLVIAACCACARADVSHILHQYDASTPPPGPPNPYVFSYQAGRAPGHVDRQHTEVSDGSGVVRGAFSYVDPRNQLRTVQYVADKNGFHPQLSHEQEDTAAVKLAKKKHLADYNRIAQEHEHAAIAGPAPYAPTFGAAPANSEAVAHATHKHLNDFQRIRAEHAAIGAAQEAQRKVLAANGQYHQHEDDGQYHEDGQYHP